MFKITINNLLSKWPGNGREMQNPILCLLSFETSKPMSLEDLQFAKFAIGLKKIGFLPVKL